MPRFLFVPAFAMVLALDAAPLPAFAAASPVPSAGPSAANPDAPTKDDARNAGTIDGTVTDIDYTPGKSKMVVKAGAQTYSFAVQAGTNVQGPSHDFAVDVKIGTHVSVSASKVGTAYTAQIIRVISAHSAH